MAEEQENSLRVQNETLQREVRDLRAMVAVMKENMELHAELRSLSTAIESSGYLGTAGKRQVQPTSLPRWSIICFIH